MKARWFLWLPVLLVAGFVAVAILRFGDPERHPMTSPMVGQPLAAFDLAPAAPGLEGVSPADFRDGTPRLLNLWASWCPPCVAEAPQLAALEAAGAPIVGVAIRDRPEDVAAFLARHGDPYERVGADPRAEVQIAVGSTLLPETFVIDGRGTVTYHHVGDIRARDVPRLLEELRKAGG